MKVSLKEMQNAETRLKNFIKGNKRLPNYTTLINMDNKKSIEVPKEEVNGLFFNYYNFWNKQNRFPEYTTLNIKKSEPTILNYQDNKYNCCPASLSMVSTKLFNPKSESTLAKLLGTNSNGTNPNNLINNNTGFTIKRMNRNANEVQKALNEYKGVICHYETGGAKCSGFVNNYGHYCVIKSVEGTNYRIYDPTKGEFLCSISQMNNATNGRALYYYSVELK